MRQSSKARARHAAELGIADTEETGPGDVSIRMDALANLGVGHRGKVDHRLSGKEIKPGPGPIRTRHQPIDLIGLGAEQRVVTGQVTLSWKAVLKTAREALDGAQAPGDARREKRIDKCERMRQHRPAVAGRAGQAVLNPRPERE